MQLFTLDLPTGRINQPIRDALGLDVTHNHGLWIIAAHNRTFAVHLLQARGFPNLPSDGKGLLKAKGGTVDALTAAGMLDEPIVLVRKLGPWPGDPVAVVVEGGMAHRVGVIEDDGGDARYVPDDEVTDRG